ncbi:MAG: SprT family zinc-dependent metalloprotease [Sulfuricurvum sp.]|nr:SprT family zinc-dependent metalloprotease [Sulfuricurvum sp.]
MKSSPKFVPSASTTMQRDNVTVVYKDIKHANLKVKPNQEVLLTVPLDMTDREIDHILHKRANWINQQLALFQKNTQPKKELVSGESFVYLGRNYRLKVIESNEEKARLNRGYFELFVKDKNDYNKKEKLINDWYKSRAVEYFQKNIEKYNAIVKLEIKAIRIRSMKTRWGSCNPKKSYINLNLELIKKPKSSIEYVIFHELVHLIHNDHSKNFYNYLSLHMPDWQKRKDKLEYI